MDYYLKAIAVVLVCSVLCLAVSVRGKEFALVISLAACCIVLIVSVSYLKPIITLMERLAQMGTLKSPTLSILLKAVAIAILSEIAEFVCNDAGNHALGKSLQTLSVVMIIWLSIPLIEELLDLIDSMFKTA